MLAPLLRRLHTMELRPYLDSLPHGEIAKFAKRLGITPVYLQQLAARQGGREPSPKLCIRIWKESGQAVTLQELRPTDWRETWPHLDRVAAVAA
jgi:DNA-binding transcriptional regulator YdaS (Cro superfamily)